MKKVNGSISIYFTFSIILIISVVMSITEIARINCQKLYLQIATDSALDSMASLYHRDLYEWYGLYGVEYRTNDMLRTEYLSFMEPYFTDGTTNLNNWYSAVINEANIDLKYNTLIYDTYLENEMINYMKVKMIGKTIKFLGKNIFIEQENNFDELVNEANGLFEETKKGSIYSEVHDRYFDFSKSIIELEKCANQIKNYIDKVNNSLSNIKNMSTSGSSSNGGNVLKKFDNSIKETDSLLDALSRFRKKMADFRGKVYESKLNYENDKLSNEYEYSEEVCEFIESEFAQFLSYVDENSKMNQEVEQGFILSSEMKIGLMDEQSSIKSYVDELISIEEKIKNERKQRGDDRDNDYIKDLVEERKDTEKDLSDFLKELKNIYKEKKMESIEISTSSVSHDEEVNLLNKLIGFKNGILLNLVLDNDKVDKISKDEVNIKKFDVMSKNNLVSIEKVLCGEYELEKFNYFNKELNEEITRSKSNALEVERLICDKNSDIENLKSTINKILLIRIAMNVLYIYTHPEKRALVREFTMSLFSGFSLLLAEAMFLVVLTAWGTAQAIADVKKLLNNKRVSFLHTDETWTVSLNNIIAVARENIEGVSSEDDNGFALNYKDYLRLLLMIERQEKINGRIAGIIENNIKNKQSNFDFEKLIYSFDVSNNFYCKYFFTRFVFVNPKSVELSNAYNIKTHAYRSFYE